MIEPSTSDQNSDPTDETAEKITRQSNLDTNQETLDLAVSSFQKSSIQLAVNSLKKGQCFVFAPFSLTESEIIAYAKVCDPLPIHVDPSAAAKGYFGGIIASGPQLFSVVHSREFVPRFGEQVIAGAELRNWKFLRPTYPDQNIHASLEVLDIKSDQQRGTALIHWRYEFRDDSGNLLQHLEPVILHSIKNVKVGKS